MASAVADAMGGPHEGRSTQKSRQFLRDGGWIDDFSSYSAWYQHHWNCYQEKAPAGTFTDDTRMRLSMARFMVEHGKTSARPMTRRELARFVVQQYQRAFWDFQKIDRRFQRARQTDEAEELAAKRKEKFLAMWYAWEIAKTATSEYIPKDVPIFSPPYIRVTDNPKHPDYSPVWHLEPRVSKRIDRDIKGQYHHDSYQKGLEMPLGLIHLLPVAAYFPGQPRKAFEYVLRIDFFDIKNAPFYAATATAIIADLLGGTSWEKVSRQLLKKGVSGYLGVAAEGAMAEIDNGIRRAILLAKEHRAPHPDRKSAVPFIFALHQAFGTSDEVMHSVQELLFVAVACMEFAGEDLNFLIELGVNYGRDNDTVASIAATMAGAMHGASALNKRNVDIVKKANPDDKLDQLAVRLCMTIRKLKFDR